MSTGMPPSSAPTSTRSPARPPGEPAFAAAIFLHRNSYSAAGASRPTSGCVSLAEDDLEFALRLIDPSLGVQFAIGELSWLRDAA